MNSYNIGDRVRIKSLEWYNENKDRYGSIECGFYCFTKEMSVYCGQVMAISDKLNHGILKMEKDSHLWTDQMIEDLVEELYTWYPIVDEGEYWTEYDINSSDEYRPKIATIVTDGIRIYTREECTIGWGTMARSGNWKYMRIKID